MEKDSGGHLSVGTTCRADPVNSVSMLYPNGYNRNENRTHRPLVLVRDTAGEDDDLGEDNFDFTSGSPSDNVTVTITFNSKTDSVIAETRSSNNGDTELISKATNYRNNSKGKDKFGHQISANAPVEEDINRSTIIDHVDKNDEELHSVADTDKDSQLLGACAMDITNNKPANRTGIRAQDSLYDEYEKLVEPETHNPPLRVFEERTTVRQNDQERSSPKTPVRKPAEDMPDLRVEMISPLTKTPILIERSSSEDDSGEDFMKYLSDLRNTNKSEQSEDNTNDVIEQSEHFLPQQTKGDSETEYISENTSPKIEQRDMDRTRKKDSVTEIEVEPTGVPFVEIEDSSDSDVETQQDTTSLFIDEPNDTDTIDIIEISDEEGSSNSAIVVSDDGADSVDLLNFNFASLSSPSQTKSHKGKLKKKKKQNDRNYNVEIVSESSSDTEDEDDDNESQSIDISYVKDKDKDDSNDRDRGNGSGNNQTGNGNQTNTRQSNNHEHGGNSDKSGGSKAFSFGVRSRPNETQDTSETFNYSSENIVTNKVAITDEPTPEDIEVSEILDVTEKQNDVQHHFQTIDSYRFETSSESSDLASGYNVNVNKLSFMSSTPKSQSKHCDESTETSSKAGTSESSFDVFAETESYVSDGGDSNISLDKYFASQSPVTLATMNCETEIKDVCEEITHFCDLGDNDDISAKQDFPIEMSDSDSSPIANDEVVSDFESAIEEQFWNNTANCSLASSEIDDDDDDDVNEEVCTDKPLVYNEKESDSEYESAVEDDDSYVDSGSELDFVAEIEARLVRVGEQTDRMGNKVGSNESTHDCDINENIEVVSVGVNKDNESFADSREQENATQEKFKLESEKDIPALENRSVKEPSLTHRDKIEASLNCKPRTISYQIPYIKEPQYKEFNLSRSRKLKHVCKLRQFRLRRVLPNEKGDICGNADDNDDDISESLKHFQEQIEIDADNGYQKVKDVAEKHKDKILPVGLGFYIFGTGDKLKLPIGPRLKPTETLNKAPTIRSSVYFRGVPGIINNAYKMSNSFPKLGLPKETASTKILHACNRLATPQSPGKSKPKPETKHGMMHESVSRDDLDDNDDTDSSTASEMYELLLCAKDLLNSSRFEDAETTFLKLYNEIQEKPDHNGRLLVETLTGLADICIRQSRMCRSNPLEWQWLCMHAIALLQYTVEYCESELENQLDNELIDWYQEHKQAAELKCRPLEDAFNRALYNCLKHDASSFDPFQSFSLPNTPVTKSKKSNLFPLSSTMPQYLVMPGMSYRVTDKGLTKHSSDDSNLAVDWLAKFQHYCKDRLVNKDSKGVTEKILKSNSSKTDDDTESILSAGSNGSLDWDHSDLQGIDEMTMEVTDPDTSPENDYTFEYEIITSDTEKEGWDFFINQRRNCNFESVVQMAVDGEKNEERHRDAGTHGMSKENRDIYQVEKTEKGKQKIIETREIISPLHEHSISLTLARLFCRLADKLVQEEEYGKSEAVYEKILDIIDHIQDGTAGMLRFSARIMKNLGTVKSKQGKSSSGLVLLNKALHTYRDLQDEEANFEIAIALIELGNGYIVGKNHEDSVFNDVIIAICDFFEKDAGDSQTASTSSAGSASQLSQMTSSLSSNNEDRNVEEAVTCYTEAIALLDRYEADEKQVDMFAKAVMRLGDCYFMQNDYDKALECYEKSLTMFRANNIFGKVSLMENAHVLCMLGVSSFMLHVYPRAASVFEMALHMVRCAYGFKRTFLNGMLQSLSGITYYKMKNYHKCVSMCYQAYETYCEIFGEEMSRLDKQKFWLVCQTLYVMGNSYNILNLQAKAMKYLTIARSLMKSSKCRERRQFMRVLQILGDAYFAQYDYKTALQFYNEALEYGECESQISFDEVFDPNCASDEMTIHNHLVSKSAEAHLSMQQYQNAVHYLEQAHDIQEVMGEDIKEDLINTLNQLGYMHSVSGDVNKAIEAYKECLEVFREIHQGELGPEMCTTLGNLAAMCYVKACIAEDPSEDINMTAAAENYFQNAMKLEVNTEVCVKYGNFLYSHCQYQDAIVHLNNALSNDRMATDIVYGGLEKVTLPDLLQDEVDTQEEICLPSTCLARYLLILCHKAVHQSRDAEDNLIGLMEEVNDYDIPLLHSILGYAMMELTLFEEAALCFLSAAENEDDYHLACENFCICVLVLLQRLLRSAIENIWLYYCRKNGALRR